MILGLDHIVIVVSDLEQAITDYRALGFTVVPGGEHPGRATHNALVVFSDGVYLELIAFQKRAEEHPWWVRSQRIGEGLLDYALLPGAIEQEVSVARRRGLELAGPFAGGRLRPDGIRVAWQTARAATSDVPFLCGDITSRSLRVPEGDARIHRNGATHVVGITLAVADLDSSVQRYQALLDGRLVDTPLVVQQADIPILGIRRAIFALGHTLISLMQPLGTRDEAGTLYDFIAQYGEGLFSVVFRVPRVAAAVPLDPARTHGAQLRFVAAERNIRGLKNDLIGARQNVYETRTT